MKHQLLAPLLVFVTLMAMPLAAQTPLGTDFTYQGRLAGNDIPAISTADFQFSLFDDESVGALAAPMLLKENVGIVDGLFTVSLDFGADAFNGDARWIEVAVRSPAGSGGFATLTPRQPITAAPHAMYAVQTRGIAVDAANNVGIGTSTPAKKLTVAGDMELGVNNADYRHMRIGGGNSDGFLYGSYPAFGDGIHLGYNHYADANGSNQIIQFDGGTSRLSLGYGTIALATSSAGNPFNRMVVNEQGRIGIGTTAPEVQLHVKGKALFQTVFTLGGAALQAEALGDTGFSYGVVGSCESSDGFGVYSEGDLGASGTKSFRIDHPFDPENKYLLHYCAEGPEPQNVYNGTVHTDSAGNARVQLPEYFEEINRDFRYQLTCIGDFAQAIVAEKIKDNSFLIRTDKPNVEVCWEVKGVRNDPYVRSRGAPVEKEKQGRERGTYQHPELYGQPKEKGLSYRPPPAAQAPTAAPKAAGP